MSQERSVKSSIVTRPQIGLTGSLGYGNYGDELYIKTYEYWLGQWADLHLVTDVHRSPEYLTNVKTNVINLMDAIVLGGGDLLCPYREFINPNFNSPVYLKRPVHIAGIGVERNRDDIDEEVLEKWKSFLCDSNIASISMRDPGSKEWIEEHIQPQVPVTSHPDWVCALPLPEVEKKSKAPVLGIITRHIKSGKEYKMLKEVGDLLKSQGWRVIHIIGGVGGHGKKDYENSKLLEIEGKEIVYTQDLDKITRSIGKCDLVISMKLHTTLVALMYGVPTISLNPVVKTRAFMERIGYGKFALKHDDKSIFELIEEGIPAPSEEAVNKVREEAVEAMKMLGQRIWTEFREQSVLKEFIPDSPCYK